MKSLFKFLAVIFGAILLDQISKGILLYLVTGTVPLYGAAWSIVPQPWIIARVTDFFNIVFTWNPGASFSMFRALGEAAPIFMVVATAAIIGFIGYYALRRAGANERLPLALILGGAIGNLIDRIRFGAVVDFLDFHIGSLHYPSFNVADICICVGVGLYLLNWVIARVRASNKGGK
ncbi:signal peptidase II [bacterium]|nr:signal peptidase II [bacterium]